MNWSDIAAHIKHDLPCLAEALKSDNAATTIVSLAAVLGVTPTPEAIMKSFQTTNGIECLKALDSSLKNASREPAQQQGDGVDFQGLADVSAARSMQLEAMHRGKGDFANRFAVVVFLSCFAMIGVMLLHGASAINDNMRFYVLGFLQSVVMAIIGFYFGSTSLSRRDVSPSAR